MDARYEGQAVRQHTSHTEFNVVPLNLKSGTISHLFL